MSVLKYILSLCIPEVKILFGPYVTVCEIKGGNYMELALGSWALIKTTPSLLALIPLLAYLVMVFMNKSNLAGLIVGVIVAAILTGQGIGSLASIFNSALGSFLGTIGLIIMFGSGLGYLMRLSSLRLLSVVFLELWRAVMPSSLLLSYRWLQQSG